MTRINFLLVLVAIVLFGSCAESPLDMDQENLILPDLQIMNNKKELPAEFQDVPLIIKDALLGLYETKIGANLVNRAAEALKNSGIKARFVYQLGLKNTFKYIGNGCGEYNFAEMSTDDILQLVFHELIHMAQEPKGRLSYLLETEIEAYLGQYFYCMMSGKEFKALRGNNLNFEEKIKSLAQFFDIYTGKATNESMFQHAFLIALAEIGLHPLYGSDKGWKIGPSPYSVRILSSLMIN